MDHMRLPPAKPDHQFVLTDDECFALCNDLRTAGVDQFHSSRIIHKLYVLLDQRNNFVS